jgi:hypothetical protein
MTRKSTPHHPDPDFFTLPLAEVDPEVAENHQ